MEGGREGDTEIGRESNEGDSGEGGRKEGRG